MILDTFPSAKDFYKTYWGKKPFIVRGLVSADQIDSFIDGNTLAGLALDNDIKSRIVTNTAAGDGWTCEHGPFDDNRFDDIGQENWSLLVQNVEQYHPETAQLLTHFQVSPRWLLDDIMVSFSAPGGSVGPHTDSYHTFLVQGIGRRTWKISANAINDDRYIDNPDMKILQNGFEGETFEVTAGDVIYMPPFFGHEGTTLEAAMTFSVGFLGPKLSEILGEYAQYLEENDPINKRYLGTALDTDSAAFSIARQAQETLQSNITAAVQSDDFSIWLASYFSRPTHDDVDNINLPEEETTREIIQDALQNGQKLNRPAHIKLTITPSSNSGFYIAVYGEIIQASAAQKKLINLLNKDQSIGVNEINALENQEEALDIITALYNKGALSVID